MALAAFDTLQIFEDLEKAGFDESKAKAISAVVRTAHESSDLATKADVQHSEERIDTKLESLRRDVAGLEARFDARHESLRKDMEVLRKDIIIKLGGIVIGAATVIPLLFKLLHIS